jgi:hypothetical protein
MQSRRMVTGKSNIYSKKLDSLERGPNNELANISIKSVPTNGPQAHSTSALTDFIYFPRTIHEIRVGDLP